MAQANKKPNAAQRAGATTKPSSTTKPSAKPRAKAKPNAKPKAQAQAQPALTGTGAAAVAANKPKGLAAKPTGNTAVGRVQRLVYPAGSTPVKLNKGFTPQGTQQRLMQLALQAVYGNKATMQAQALQAALAGLQGPGHAWAAANPRKVLRKACRCLLLQAG